MWDLIVSVPDHCLFFSSEWIVYSLVQKVITLRDLQKVFSHGEH